MINAIEQTLLIRGIKNADGYAYEEFTSAAGIAGNFKVNLPDALDRDKRLRKRFVGHMAIELADVDVIAAVGGAVDFAAEVAFDTGKQLVEVKSRTVDNQKQFYIDEEYNDVLGDQPDVGFVEDVSSSLLTVKRAVNETTLRGLVKYGVCGWRRGKQAPEYLIDDEAIIEHDKKYNYKDLFEVPLDFPMKYLIENYLPLWMQNRDVALWLPEMAEIN
jgi:hypothetical protein